MRPRFSATTGGIWANLQTGQPLRTALNQINGAVVETVTGEPPHAYSDVYVAPAFSYPRNRVGQAGTSGLSLEQRARVHSRYVISLQADIWRHCPTPR